MSSSTSSSSSRPAADPPGAPKTAPHRGRYLALAALLLFTVLEVTTRCVLFPASKDFSRFATYPARAAKLSGASGTRLALIGNSATEQGVDLDTFRTELAAQGTRATVDMFVADASNLNTWYWMLQSEFWKRRRGVDFLIIPFFNGLADDGTLEVPRLALFFTDPSDWADVFRHDLPDFERRVDFVLSSGWATFGARDRVRERALDAIPGYKSYIRDINAVNFAKQERLARRAPTAPTYKDLGRLLDAARQNHAHIVFVAFPLRRSASSAIYDITPETAVLIRDAGMELIDLRLFPELRAEHYDDEIHLNAAGRAIFSPRLAREVSRLVPRT